MSPPRGQAKREKSLAKITAFLLTDDSRPKTIKEIMEATSLTKSTVIKNLKLLEKQGSVIREVIDAFPPRVQYMFTESLSEETMEQERVELEQAFNQLGKYLDSASEIEIQAKQAEIDHMLNEYRAHRGDKESTTGQLQKLKLIAFKKIREGQRLLSKNLSLQSERDRSDKSFTCGNCRYGRKIVDEIDDIPGIKCVRFWTKGKRNLLYPSIHKCEHYVSFPIFDLF